MTLPSLKGAEWLERPETRAVFEALEQAGYPARAVGGVVRNALMGIAVTDIDIATPARPDAIVAAARAAGLGAVPTGIAHGTITVIAGHAPYEVTTLRRDVSTDGRRATVAFTDDWAEDAGRRDFTINALYCDRHGTVFDPLGGLPDVAARRIRFIGDPDRRIAEDYLRILRFFRFHAAFGEREPDPAGMAACVRGRIGLPQLSAERIRAELMKLLVAPRAYDAVAAMVDCGLLAGLLRAAPRPGVLAQVIDAERRLGATPDPVTRLSALAVAVEEDIPALSRRLRLSGREREALQVIDRSAAERFLGLDGPGARRLLYRLGVDAWLRQVLAAAALAPDRAELAALYGLPERWQPPRLPAKGADLIALGVPAGPRVGAMLAALESWWIEADFPDEAAVRARLQALAGNL